MTKVQTLIDTPPVVSIVIVNWNACDILRDCLKSIKEQTNSTYEIIVVDNASHDGSATMVAEKFPDVTLVANETNRGFAAANNQGILVSQGRYLLLLNPDTLILDHALDRMIAWCEARPDVGCAGCQVMRSSETIQRTCFTDPSPLNCAIVEAGLDRLLPHSPFFGRPSYSSWDRKSEKEVDVVTGVFMLIPRHVLDEVGLLDEAFFVYAEEADLCRRVRDAGYRCVFTPTARIMHLDGGGKSTSQIKPRMRVQLQKSLLIYINKHNGSAAAALTRCVFIVSNFLRWGIFGVAAFMSRSAKLRDSAHLARTLLMYHLFKREPSA